MGWCSVTIKYAADVTCMFCHLWFLFPDVVTDLAFVVYGLQHLSCTLGESNDLRWQLELM